MIRLGDLEGKSMTRALLWQLPTDILKDSIGLIGRSKMAVSAFDRKPLLQKNLGMVTKSRTAAFRTEPPHGWTNSGLSEQHAPNHTDPRYWF